MYSRCVHSNVIEGDECCLYKNVYICVFFLIYFIDTDTNINRFKMIELKDDRAFGVATTSIPTISVVRSLDCTW